MTVANYRYGRANFYILNRPTIKLFVKDENRDRPPIKNSLR